MELLNYKIDTDERVVRRAPTNWNDFHHAARAAVPQQELRPERCYIGVLKHEKDPQGVHTQEDFVWMIGQDVRS